MSPGVRGTRPKVAGAGVGDSEGRSPRAGQGQGRPLSGTARLPAQHSSRPCQPRCGPGLAVEAWVQSGLRGQGPAPSSRSAGKVEKKYMNKDGVPEGDDGRERGPCGGVAGTPVTAGLRATRLEPFSQVTPSSSRPRWQMGTPGLLRAAAWPLLAAVPCRGGTWGGESASSSFSGGEGSGLLRGAHDQALAWPCAGTAAGAAGSWQWSPWLEGPSHLLPSLGARAPRLPGDTGQPPLWTPCLVEAPSGTGLEPALGGWRSPGPGWGGGRGPGCRAAGQGRGWPQAPPAQPAGPCLLGSGNSLPSRGPLQAPQPQDLLGPTSHCCRPAQDPGLPHPAVTLPEPGCARASPHRLP